MGVMDIRAQRVFKRALRRDPEARGPYLASAKVASVVDGVAYVRLHEGEAAVPLDASLVTFEPGDTVRVRVSHEGIEATGNETSPSASVMHLNQVIEHRQSEQYKRIEAEFLKVGSLEALEAKVGKLRADMASIGDLDVEGVLTLKGTIRQIDESLTEAMNSIWGHYEEVTAPLRDEDGNLVLDENGNVIPVTKKVWVTDAAMIAERLESDPAKWTGLAYNEMALQLAHESVAKRLGDIESGVHISDDPDNPFITIGRLGSRATLAMTNEAIELAAEDDFGNVKHAFRVTSEATSAERLEVTNYMKVGRYALVPRMDGGLALQYVG